MIPWYMDQSTWVEYPAVVRDGDRAFAFKNGVWVVLRASVREIPRTVEPRLWTPEPEKPEFTVTWAPDVMLTHDGRALGIEVKCGKL